MEQGMSKILIIEDDTNINQMLNEALTKKGYQTVSAYSGTEGLLRVQQEACQLIILDLILPGMNGQDVLANIRKYTSVPVIVLSAKDELDTKVDLLTLGANDYMTKPFELKELEARILVQLRNHVRETERLARHKDLCMNFENRKVTLCGKQLSLTPQEYKILELLLKHPRKVFTKNEIYEYAWETYYEGEDKTLHVHISNIRQKLKKITNEEYIETVWGFGFKLAE